MTDKQIDSYEEYQKIVIDFFYKDINSTKLVEKFLKNKIVTTKVESNLGNMDVSFSIFEDKEIKNINISLSENTKNLQILDKNIQELESESSNKETSNFGKLFNFFLALFTITILGLSIYHNNWNYMFLIFVIPVTAGILSAIFARKTDYKKKEEQIISSTEFENIKNLLINRLNYDDAHKTVFKFNDINIKVLDNKKMELPEEKIITWTENELKSYFFTYAGNLTKQLNEFKTIDKTTEEIWNKLEGGKLPNKANIRSALFFLPTVYGNIHRFFLSIKENKKINEEFLLIKENPKAFEMKENYTMKALVKIQEKDIEERNYFINQLLSISSDYKLNEMLKNY